jgi:hypothetical protein
MANLVARCKLAVHQIFYQENLEAAKLFILIVKAVYGDKNLSEISVEASVMSEIT